VPELLAPVTRREVSNVHAVLVGDVDWLESLRLADPTLYLPEPITVPMFRLGEISRLGREYCARMNWLPVSAPVVRLLDDIFNEKRECTGEDLDHVLKLVKLMAG
jgi:hypothetical protein